MRTATATVFIAGAILMYQLFIPPSIGLANNGDFGKVIGIYGLAAPQGDENAYADLKYSFRSDNHWFSGFYSSEMLLVGVAIVLNGFFSKTGIFDLRWMGFVHGVLFLLSCVLFQRLIADIPRPLRVTVSAGMLLVFTDVMYVSYLNSFYMDASTYVFLMLSVVLFVRSARWRSKADAVCLLVCGALMATSKPQHAVLGLWIAVLFMFCGSKLWSGNGRVFATASTSVMLLASVFSIMGATDYYRAIGCYSVIFYQVLPHSVNVTRDLSALGLDRSYGRWIGTHAFSNGAPMDDPAFVRSFVQRTSYTKLGLYFLTHPRDAYLALDTSLSEAGRQRPELGNFDRSSGLPAFAESHTFAIWSDAKRKVFQGHGTRYLIFSLLVASLVCALATAQRTTLTDAAIFGAYALAGMGITAMLVASLADAVDVPRHHFISGALLDLETFVALMLATRAVQIRCTFRRTGGSRPLLRVMTGSAAAEAFNSVNNVAYGTPDSNLSGPTFSKVFGTANSPRIPQLGLKVVF